MNDTLIEVRALVPIDDADAPRLLAAIERARDICEKRDVIFQPSRLVLLGVHLAGAMKRFETGEVLDPFSESMYSQASTEAMEMAAQILEPLTAAPLRREEKFLVAVHIDTARIMARKGKE